MARFILDVNEEWGTTIILIEHDMGVVMDISDRVAVLDMGQKIAEGTPDEVRANPAVIKAYLGETKTQRGPQWLNVEQGSPDASPAARPQRPRVRPARGHAREGSRHLAGVDVARVPRSRARPRARAGRAGLQARRQALGHRRQPPAALRRADGRAVPGRRVGARVPGLDRQGAGLRLEPRRGVGHRGRGPGAGGQDPRPQGRAPGASLGHLRRPARHARVQARVAQVLRRPRGARTRARDEGRRGLRSGDRAGHAGRRRLHLLHVGHDGNAEGRDDQPRQRDRDGADGRGVRDLPDRGRVPRVSAHGLDGRRVLHARDEPLRGIHGQLPGEPRDRAARSARARPHAAPGARRGSGRTCSRACSSAPPTRVR